MVFKKDILATIDKLDGLYNAAGSPMEATYYCKLAIIELCGWIEFAMDEVAKRYVMDRLKKHDFKTAFLQSIAANNDFSYPDFKRMIHRSIGFHNWETLHGRIPPANILILETTLDLLKKARNEAAHEHTKVATAFQATSVTKSQLNILYPIFRNLFIEMGRIP